MIFTPKGGMCLVCEHKAKNCGDLPFHAMPVIDSDGTVTRVKCTEFARAKPPAPPASPLTDHHAVRWAQRDIANRFDTEYSRWHWTTDATKTLCGRRIVLISDGPAMLPETNGNTSRVDCKQCRQLLTKGVTA